MCHAGRARILLAPLLMLLCTAQPCRAALGARASRRAGRCVAAKAQKGPVQKKGNDNDEALSTLDNALLVTGAVASPTVLYRRASSTAA